MLASLIKGKTIKQVRLMEEQVTDCVARVQGPVVFARL